MRQVLVAFLLAGCVLTAQQPAPYFTDVFPLEEFAARRGRVMERIGDAVAVIQGAPEMSAEVAFRQNNQFFYLTGVEVPRAILLIDGKAKRSTLYLAPPRRERYNGPELGPGTKPPRITGLESVVARETFAAAVAQLGQEGRVVFTPHRAEVRGGGSGGEATGHARATSADPWDGRLAREAAFMQKLQEAAPKAQIKDLDPTSTPCVSSRARVRLRSCARSRASRGLASWKRCARRLRAGSRTS